MTHQQLAPDSVDMPVLHGTHAGPALPVGSQFRVPRHITARDDDLGIALQHGLYRYRRRKVRQVGKNIAAATKPDDITDKVIAIDLGISQRTVEIHRSRVMEKMGTHSLAHLVRMVITARS